MITIGGCAALTVPISGIVTWKSASTSSRNASNASSVRSSSSISSTGAPARIGLERLQQRPLDQEAVGEHIVLQPLAVGIAFGFAEPNRDHLRGVIPFIDRGRNVEPFVALQPDQPPSERLRQHLGDLGLADAGLALEKQRPAHLESQKQHGRERPVADIMAGGEQRQRVVDGGGNGASTWCSMRRPQACHAQA